MNQIERIKTMEEKLDKASKMLSQLETALEHYNNLHSSILELEEYYHSEQWLIDYNDDAAGKLPEDLKRGVLSEDALYLMLSQHDELIRNIRQLFYPSN